MAFVHLHNHTEYSLLDGHTRVDEMIDYAHSLGMTAIAITDHGYMYGVPAFVSACAKTNGKAIDKWKEEAEEAKAAGRPEPPKPHTIKPIIGCEIYFTPDSSLSRDQYPDTYHMILLAKNEVGYHNLIHIVSDAATRGFYYRPRVTLETLREYSEGLIGTSACIAGIIPKSLDRGQRDIAIHWAKTLKEIFAPGDFYIEIQDHGPEVKTDSGMTEAQINEMLISVADELDLKIIATNDMHYLKKEDAYAQDVLLCIGMARELDDPTRMKFKNDQFYLKTEEEMREIFKAHPEACDNTNEIAEKCNVELSHDLILPSLPLPEGETNESMLWKNCIAGLKVRYGDPIPDNVMERFEYEYEIITTKGFAAYFLIVEEFTRWAKDNGIGVGPGRGSAAGSIVSYALDITTFDPLENGLLFERFLSPERTEMPDIDMDFDDERRGDVIDHVKELYGEARIANIITFNKLKARQAMQDATRVLGYPMSKGLSINKLFLSPFATIKQTFDPKHENYNPDFVNLYKTDPEAKQIIDTAMTIEGSIRGEGVHASAVVICRDPLEDHVPIKLDTKGGAIISQYDGVNIADLGLLKMDFLGLRNLTVMKDAVANIKNSTGEDVDIENIDFRDPAIYELFARGDTKGIFQVESAGLTSLLQRMKPDRYSDIIAAIALYRPGPIGAGMLDDFVERKQGLRKIQYYDDRLKGILEDTYGTIVYQEQVMLISVEMSGFSMGESDKVRKAVAKKKIALMTQVVSKWSDGREETMKDHWLNGAVRNGYDLKIAQKIWDDVEKFAAYAFNKSHSAAYAIITMQTAWLKAHYPREYMAAVMTSYMGKKSDKIKAIIADCKSSGIDVLPPDINTSRDTFTAVGDYIRFGLAGIKGIGYGCAEYIIKEREENGPYTSLHDFVKRVPNKIANRRTVETLIKSGAFDSLGYTRRQLMLFIERDNIMDRASQRQRDAELGQVSMFDMFDDSDGTGGFEEDIPKPDNIEWDRKVKLDLEKEVMGFYISDHPLSPYKLELDEISEFSLLDLTSTDDGDDDEQEVIGGSSYDSARSIPTDRDILIAGMVTDLALKTTKNGDRMAVFTLEDMDGSVPCIVFPKVYGNFGSALAEERIVKVKGRYDRSDRGVQIRVSAVNELDFGKKVIVELPQDAVNADVVRAINSTFKEYPGKNDAVIRLSLGGGKYKTIELPIKVDSANGAISAYLHIALENVPHKILIQ